MTWTYCEGEVNNVEVLGIPSQSLSDSSSSFLGSVGGAQLIIINLDTLRVTQRGFLP